MGQIDPRKRMNDTRKNRSLHLTDEEHRRYINLGGSKWVQEQIAREWEKVPEERRNWPRPEKEAR
jgi:hypothetical protein